MKKTNIIKNIILFLMIIIIFFTIIALYNLGYKSFFKSDYPYFLNYSTHTVIEENYLPEYKLNNTVILKKESFYSENDIIVFKNNSTYKLAKIKDYDSLKYYAIDKNDNFYYINESNIIGKAIINLHGFSLIYTLFTSQYIILFMIILTGLYFLLTIYEKNS